jgi:hypothetical protein
MAQSLLVRVIKKRVPWWRGSVASASGTKGRRFESRKELVLVYVFESNTSKSDEYVSCMWHFILYVQFKKFLINSTACFLYIIPNFMHMYNHNHIIMAIFVA